MKKLLLVLASIVPIFVDAMDQSRALELSKYSYICKRKPSTHTMSDDASSLYTQCHSWVPESRARALGRAVASKFSQLAITDRVASFDFDSEQVSKFFPTTITDRLVRTRDVRALQVVVMMMNAGTNRAIYTRAFLEQVMPDVYQHPEVFICHLLQVHEEQRKDYWRDYYHGMGRPTDPKSVLRFVWDTLAAAKIAEVFDTIAPVVQADFLVALAGVYKFDPDQLRNHCFLPCLDTLRMEIATGIISKNIVRHVANDRRFDILNAMKAFLDTDSELYQVVEAEEIAARAFS